MSTILGTNLKNKLTGTSGNDILTGQGGDDTLFGGAGTDTAWHSGLAIEYLIGTSGSMLTLKDTNLANGDEGLDQLGSIEKLVFSNTAFTVSSGEIQINTTTANDQSAPAITALTDGGYVVTWMSLGQDDVNWYGIYAQRYEAQGNKAGGEVLVNTTTAYSQSFSAITALADGGYVVTWSSVLQDDGSSTGIYAQRFDAQGNKIGGEVRVNTTTANSQDFPAITALADGGYVVTWQSDDASFSGIYAQRYDAQGNTIGGEILVNTTTANYQVHPAITALADGGYVVTWESDLQDGDGYGIYAQRYDAQGNTTGSEVRVNTTTANDQYQPAITALVDGGHVVTWTSHVQDGSSYGIYAQRYDAQGNTIGGEVRVNTTTANIQDSPAITALADGGYVVTWQSDDASFSGIYAQRYDAQGNTIGGEILVNTTTANYQVHPAITALADGGYVVTWESNDGSFSGIYAQRYDAAGNAIGLKVTGTPGADTINLGANTLLTVDGGSGNDSISGGASDDNLYGSQGNDKLTGGDGDDRLDGGAGADAMIGGNGGDIYVVDVAGDVIAETGNGGTDTVLASISYTLGATLENLTLTGINASGSLLNGSLVNINATGNASGNLLIGNSGDNILDGKAGGDMMVGRTGNDTYIVDNLLDLVAEDADAGDDVVKSGVDFALSDNVEQLLLTGTLHLNGSGNNLDNMIMGNTGNNTLAGDAGDDNISGQSGNDNLDGGTGVDWLIGGAGADTLTGGDGDDIFYFDQAPSAANTDHITDFVTGFDTIFLKQSIFTNAGFVGELYYLKFLATPIISATSSENIIYNTFNGNLYYNADGNKSGAPVLVATLDGAPDLSASDIWLV